MIDLMASCVRIVAVPHAFRDRPPRKLYRRFTDKAHAEEFISGNIRFRSLASYRSIEDERRKDADEGIRTQKLGAGTCIKLQLSDGTYGAPLTLESGHFRQELKDAADYMIACFSVRRNQRQRSFGPWLVTINHADKLLAHMRKAFPHPGCLFWGRVEYYDPNTAQTVGADTSLWRQKSSVYEVEREFRIGFIVRHFENPMEATAHITGADLSHVASLNYDP